MRILLGVCGGVAAYKAAELLRELQRRGFDVRVAMTDGAMRFVQPLTFASLSGHPVLTSLWQPPAEAAEASGAEFSIEHITAAQGIAAMVIAPATANHLAKFAHGISDDFLSAAYLATQAPVILAPAMNVNMWEHAATKQNVELLESRGDRFVRPGSGYLACGMVGGGRLAEVEAIADEVERASATKADLRDETVLVTAGGTREPIDAVRFLGNRSSGRMGYALAEAAVARGARVILVSAASLPTPYGVELHTVQTAEEMRAAALRVLPECTLVLKAAAVADFRAEEVSADKLRRSGSLTLRLTATRDVVREIVEERRAGTIVVAFAAEMEDALANARAKLVRKGVDAVFVNDVSRPGIGFDGEENAGSFVMRDAVVEMERMSKRQIADRILDETMKLRKVIALDATEVWS